MLSKLPVLGRPTNLDYSRARAYCACSRCGWGCLDRKMREVINERKVFSHLSLLSSF